MEYLKLFNTESDYLAYRDGSSYLKPNVSLSDDNGEVFYNFTPPPTITYNYIDLGLPSGTKWATMNVGARKPSDSGLYFQWGDIVGYTAKQVGKDKQFSWSDYKWSIDGSETNFSKYKTTGATLELADDATHVNMGGSWHMPTPTQIQELIDNTATAWTTSDGVSGGTFTSKKDASKFIFIPAAGYAMNGLVQSSGEYGSVLASMLSPYSESIAQKLEFYLESTSLNEYDWNSGRYNGLPVRGVIG